MTAPLLPAPVIPVPLGLPALRLTRDGSPLREVALDEASTVVGRDPHLRVCLNDLGVSRCHAVFTVRGAAVWVRDMSSRNGVFVNGARIPSNEPVRLRGGEVLCIGQTQLEYRPALEARTARQPRRTGS